MISIRHRVKLPRIVDGPILALAVGTGMIAPAARWPVARFAAVLAFSPDGTKLLTGFHRGSAIVWDVR